MISPHPRLEPGGPNRRKLHTEAASLPPARHEARTTPCVAPRRLISSIALNASCVGGMTLAVVVIVLVIRTNAEVSFDTRNVGRRRDGITGMTRVFSQRSSARLSRFTLDR